LEERYQEAEESFKACLAISPDNPQTLYELSLTLNHLRKYEESMDYLTRLIKVAPEHAGAFHTRGTIHQKLDNHKFALEDFEVALAADSTNPLITFLKGRSLMELHCYQEAIDCFTKAMELNYCELDIYRCFARAFEALGNLEKALYYLNYGLKKEPTHPDFLLERSNLHVKMHGLHAALDDLKLILNDQPANGYINYKLGTVFFQNKDFPQTLDALRRAFDCGDLALTHQPNAYYIMGLSLASMDDFREAVDCFTRAIEMNPEKAVYYHERAKCLLMIDQFDQAVEDFSQTIGRQPMNSHAHFGRGFAYKNLLDFKKAVS
jgi:tetratricopeptide (TPR) repeat protein